ncbi:MAG: electron transport complex subunit RsxE [Sedimentisphaerales bacterium]|jgi:electron transport complex protein RnfE|nr:electron transport complex subunit RsxE [Planctomycetota bacterium]MDY0356589.1 electron transport complex subunit RsxE [Sedimentisphaerales bacterium]NLT77605.1 electron transport complex subunit RsxE [Planctomycetota bacterium]
MATDSDGQTCVYKNTLLAGLWRENPVLRLLLGMCPTLAVTAAVKPAFTMGMCVVFVLVCSNVMVSLMRNMLKPHLRILMFTLTIATFVTIADLLLKAFQPDMSAALGPYVPLIIVNCIIIARAEACASKNPILLSIVDALSMGAGFTVALCVLAGIREVLGTGKFFDIQVMPKAFVPWAALSMPVGAFLTLGFLLGLVALITKKRS